MNKKILMYIAPLSLLFMLSACSQDSYSDTEVTTLQDTMTQGETPLPPPTTNTQSESIETEKPPLAAITSIQNFAKKNPLNKNYDQIVLAKDVWPVSVYDEKTPVIAVKADNDEYTLIAETYEVTAFMNPEVSTKALGEKNYTKQELEQIATKFIQDQTSADLSKLNTAHGNKNDNYFFRWEDPTRKFSGQFPYFIQVGIRKDGLLFSYNNLLRLK